MTIDSSDNKTTQNITINVKKTFQSGDTFNGLVYNVVTSPITGKEWLDRNLGATQVCTSSTDSSCYGSAYRSYESAECPVGFKVPTSDELNAETLNYTGIDNPSTGAVKVVNTTTAFANFLKLYGGDSPSVNIYFYPSYNSLGTSTGNYMVIWSEQYARGGSTGRLGGFPIRCIKKN